MKRKLLIFIIMFCLVLPCATMLAGCGDDASANKRVTSIEIKDGDTQSNYLNYAYNYGEQLEFIARDLRIIATFSDGSKGELSEEQYEQVTTEISSNDAWVNFEMRTVGIK